MTRISFNLLMSRASIWNSWRISNSSTTELDLKKLKTIDQSKQDIIFGFIKQINTNKGNIEVPELIIYIILSYYYEYEIFDKEFCSKTISISGMNKNIITKTNGSCAWQTSVFGLKWIKSTTNNIYKWKIKNLTSDKCVAFGIVNINIMI